MPPAERCVAHPSRLAVDHCPVCTRARCGADTAGPGCAVCHGRHQVARAAAPDLERLVRGALAGLAVAQVSGPVLAEYVGAPVFGYLAPAVVGVACAEAVATAAAVRRQGFRHRALLRTWGVAMGVIGTAAGFPLEGTYGALDLRTRVLLPYVVAAAAAFVWSSPPRRRVTASSTG